MNTQGMTENPSWRKDSKSVRERHRDGSENLRARSFRYQGRLSATNSAGWSAPPVGMAMYCLPSAI